MEGGSFFKMSFSPWRREHSSSQFAAASKMEGGSFSKYDPRSSATHIRLQTLQQFHDGRRLFFKIRFSSQHRVRSFC
eukprot:5255845-Pyramimonas_sp.AAC.1